MLTSNELVPSFWGFLRLCQFWWKSIKKCAHGQTDRCTDWRKPIL